MFFEDGLFAEPVPGLYRTGVSPFHCVTSSYDPFMQESIDKGLKSLAELLHLLVQEISAYFGPVGVSTAVSDLHAAILKCFCWSELFTLGPQPDHVKAFMFLVRRFQPLLGRSPFPDPADFPYVTRNWSLANGEWELQYLVLVRNLQEASRLQYRRLWYSSSTFAVERVMMGHVCALLPLLLKVAPRDRSACLCVCHVVQSFLSRPSGQTLLVPSRLLRCVSHKGSSRGWTAQRGAFRGDEGSFAVVSKQAQFIEMRGKLVRVSSVVGSRLRLSEVSKAVDMDPLLHGPRLVEDIGMVHGWHAAMVHHHARAHACNESLVRAVAFFTAFHWSWARFFPQVISTKAF